MQAELRLHVDIDATPEAVWRWAVDWRRQREWIPFTTVSHVGGPVLGIGTRLVARTAIGPLGFDDHLTVTALEVPRTYEVLHTGRLVKGVGAFEVQPRGEAPESSRFVWWERVDVPGGPLAPLLWRIGEPVTRRLFGWALDRLARAVEEDAGSARSHPRHPSAPA